MTDLAIVVGGEAKRRGPSPPNEPHVFSGAPQPGLSALVPTLCHQILSKPNTFRRPTA